MFLAAPTMDLILDGSDRTVTKERIVEALQHLPARVEIVRGGHLPLRYF